MSARAAVLEPWIVARRYVMPAARASAASSSTSDLPMQLPWYRSATAKAISAHIRDPSSRTSCASPAGTASPSTYATSEWRRESTFASAVSSAWERRGFAPWKRRARDSAPSCSNSAAIVSVSPSRSGRIVICPSFLFLMALECMAQSWKKRCLLDFAQSGHLPLARSGHSHETGARPVGGRCCTRVQAELAQDVRHVAGHGGGAEQEPLRDVAVAQALGDEPQDFPLA